MAVLCAEGLDGVGKQTLSLGILAELETAVPPLFEEVAVHNFPHYDTPCGALVGRIIRGDLIIASATEVAEELNSGIGSIETLKQSWSMDKALAIQIAQAASRWEWTELTNRHKGTKNTLLILDRYKMSGEVYGEADGVPASITTKLEQSMVDPDLTFIIDVPVEESFKRRPNRRDYYEKNVEKLKRVRELYLDRYRLAVEVGDTSIILLDGMKSSSELVAEAMTHIRSWLAKEGVT